MSTITASLVATKSSHIHLAQLDGIRGFAAAYVVLHHAWLQTGPEMFPPLHRALGFLAYGQFAVATFIVLSGYLLMLPVARSHDGQLKGGIRTFASKRARRIIPPYMVALFVSIGLAGISNQLHLPPTDLEHVTAPTVVSHLLLVHNLSMSTYHAIDPPMWSVASEWQIYFAFALVLVPAWRKVGTLSTVAAAFILGVLPFGLAILHLPTFFWACPWYLGLFALGMCAASLPATG